MTPTLEKSFAQTPPPFQVAPETPSSLLWGPDGEPELSVQGRVRHSLSMHGHPSSLHKEDTGHTAIQRKEEAVICLWPGAKSEVWSEGNF